MHGRREVVMTGEMAPDVSTLPEAELSELLEAANRAAECQRVLKKGGQNLVGEVLRGQGTFYELTHYPQGDVLDRDSHSQYYYHAHRRDVDEHGHFHTFLRAEALPGDLRPAEGFAGTDSWPTGEQSIAHLIAISMDRWGDPIGLFTTNRWVTDETWFPANSIAPLVPRFEIDHAWPAWPVNLWLSAMIRLYRHQIQALLLDRDRVIEQHRDNPHVLEDRELEVLSSMPIDVPRWHEQIRVEADARLAC